MPGEISQFMAWFETVSERAVRNGVVEIKDTTFQARRGRKGPPDRKYARGQAPKIEELLRKGCSTWDICQRVDCAGSTVRMLRARMAGAKWAQKGPPQKRGPKPKKLSLCKKSN